MLTLPDSGSLIITHSHTGLIPLSELGFRDSSAFSFASDGPPAQQPEAPEGRKRTWTDAVASAFGARPPVINAGGGAPQQRSQVMRDRNERRSVIPATIPSKSPISYVIGLHALFLCPLHLPYPSPCPPCLPHTPWPSRTIKC